MRESADDVPPKELDQWRTAQWSAEVTDDAEAPILALNMSTQTALHDHMFAQGSSLPGVSPPTSAKLLKLPTNIVESPRNITVQTGKLKSSNDVESAFCEDLTPDSPGSANVASSTPANVAAKRSSWRPHFARVLHSKDNLEMQELAYSLHDLQMLEYHDVTWVFLRLLALGAGISAVGAFCRFVLDDDMIAISAVLLNLGFVMCTSALVVGSACPFDMLDVNTIFRRNIMFSIGFFALCGSISVLQGTFFPHAELAKVPLSVAACISCFTPSTSCWPAATTWCILWLVTDRISWGLIFLFPQENYQVSVYDPVSYTMCGFNLLMAPVVLCAAWVRQAAHLNSGTHEVKASTSLGLYRGFYAWLLAAGVTDFVTGLALAIKPRPGTGDVPRAGIECLRGVCVLIPAVLMVYSGPVGVLRRSEEKRKEGGGDFGPRRSGGRGSRKSGSK